MVEGDCASGLDEPKTPRKRIESFAWRNERFRIAGRKSLESLAAKLRRFARSFVFNNLTGFSFRLFSQPARSDAESPTAADREAAFGERFTSPGRPEKTERVGPRASALTIRTS
jgi:hypothetical protein